LGLFNLLPIAPLDGFKVALGFLPRDLSIEFAKLERYGLVILFSLFFVVRLLTGKFLLFEIMSPIIRVLAWLFAGTSGDPLVSAAVLPYAPVTRCAKPANRRLRANSGR